jgi:hypothetical protein
LRLLNVVSPLVAHSPCTDQTNIINKNVVMKKFILIITAVLALSCRESGRSSDRGGMDDQEEYENAHTIEADSTNGNEKSDTTSNAERKRST